MGVGGPLTLRRVAITCSTSVILPVAHAQADGEKSLRLPLHDAGVDAHLPRGRIRQHQWRIHFLR